MRSLLPLGAAILLACSSSRGAYRQQAAPPSQGPAGRGPAGPTPSDGAEQVGAFGLTNRRADVDSPLDATRLDRMRMAWFHPTPAPVSGTPLAADGRVYFTDWSGKAYAVDLESGRLVWQKQLERPAKWPWHGLAGTGALAPGGLFVTASVEGNAFAVRREDGAVVWKARITDQPHAGNLSTPLVHDGRIYLGLQSVEEPLAMMRKGFKPNFQGAILALDLQDGRTIWKRPLVLPPRNGVPVWSSFALDPELGLLYATTGNNYTGEPSALSDAVLALDARTGEIRWHRQTTGQDVWTPAEPLGPDYDFGAGPQLFEATIDGERRALVGAGQKSGRFFAFDRRTGEPLWDTTVGIAGVGGGIRGEASIGRDRIFVWSNNSWDDVGKGSPEPTKFPIDVGALDPATGRFLWQVPKAQPAIGWAAGYLAGDAYFVGSLDGTIKAYRASDGKTLATFRTPKNAAVASALNVAGDTLLVGLGVPATFGGLSKATGVAAFAPRPEASPRADRSGP